MKELIEDINQDNDREDQEDNGDSHQGASCSVGDRDNYSPPEANKDSNEDNNLNNSQDNGDNTNIEEEFEKLTPLQQFNFTRFKKKIPANAKDNIEINQLPGGEVEIKATSPGKVPGSRAIYSKQIDANGNTVKYTKTTFDPQGNIVHIKDKFGR